jgi:hypothetical protein
LNQRVFVGVGTFDFNMDKDGREVCEGGCLIDRRGLIAGRVGGIVSAALKCSLFRGPEVQGHGSVDSFIKVAIE